MRTGVLLVVLILLPSSVRSGNPDETRDQVRPLIRDLGDDDLEIRDAAQKELIEIGIPALEHLPNDAQLRALKNAEIVRRVKAIRKKLETKQAQKTTAAAQITLDVQNSPLSKVIEQLEKQSGNKIVDHRREQQQPLTDPKITIQIKDVMFLEALDQILDQAGMKVSHGASDDEGNLIEGIAFVAAEKTDGPGGNRASYDSAFRFEPTSVVARRNLRHPDANSLDIEVELTWEPKLAPISLTLLCDTIKAIDKDGNSLKCISRGESPIAVYDRNPTFGIRFELPKPDVTQIKTLQGEVETLLPGKMETFRFKDLKSIPKQRQKQAGASVSIPQVLKNNEIWQVDVLLEFESDSKALESHLIQELEDRNPAYLESADGKRVDNGGYHTIGGAENGIGLRYVFVIPNSIDDYTFIYETPAALVDRKISFDLSGIDLP